MPNPTEPLPIRIAANMAVAFLLVNLSKVVRDPWTAGLLCGASAVLLGQSISQMIRYSRSP